MSGRLNWHRNNIVQKARSGLFIKDERERMKNDAAAKWLTKAEQRQEKHKSERSNEKHLHLARQAVSKGFEQLSPIDPIDQLPGIDLKEPPW